MIYHVFNAKIRNRNETDLIRIHVFIITRFVIWHLPRSPVSASLLLPLQVMRKVGCRLVGAAVPTARHRLHFGMKVSTVVSPSSVGREEGVFGALSMATRSAHVEGPSDVSDVIGLVIGRGSVVLALRLLRTAL